MISRTDIILAFAASLVIGLTLGTATNSNAGILNPEQVTLTSMYPAQVDGVRIELVEYDKYRADSLSDPDGVLVLNISTGAESVKEVIPFERGRIDKTDIYTGIKTVYVNGSKVTIAINKLYEINSGCCSKEAVIGLELFRQG